MKTSETHERTIVQIGGNLVNVSQKQILGAQLHLNLGIIFKHFLGGQLFFLLCYTQTLSIF